MIAPICQRESQRDKNPGGGRYVTYPQGLSAGRGKPADGSFTIIIRQDVAIRQRTFLALLSVWMNRKPELVVAFVLPLCIVPCTF